MHKLPETFHCTSRRQMVVHSSLHLGQYVVLLCLFLPCGIRVLAESEDLESEDQRYMCQLQCTCLGDWVFQRSLRLFDAPFPLALYLASPSNEETEAWSIDNILNWATVCHQSTGPWPSRRALLTHHQSLYCKYTTLSIQHHKPPQSRLDFHTHSSCPFHVSLCFYLRLELVWY